jgi:hypothetical protein
MQNRGGCAHGHANSLHICHSHFQGCGSCPPYKHPLSKGGYIRIISLPHYQAHILYHYSESANTGGAALPGPFSWRKCNFDEVIVIDIEHMGLTKPFG